MTFEAGEQAGAGATALGIDTATAATAVCVLRSDGACFESVPDPADLAARPAHTTELMPRVAEQMDAAGVEMADLDYVAVGVGPGAFTGLRIGIATARGLAQAHDLPLRPVGSLEALAAGIDSPVALPLIDARRGELFCALHVDRAKRWPPFVVRPAELVERVEAARRSGLGRPLAAGDGALRFLDVLETAPIEVAPADSRRHVIRALHVCRLAALAPGYPPEAVLPRYLRAPDATPSR